MADDALKDRIYEVVTEALEEGLRIRDACEVFEDALHEFRLRQAEKVEAVRPPEGVKQSVPQLAPGQSLEEFCDLYQKFS